MKMCLLFIRMLEVEYIVLINQNIYFILEYKKKLRYGYFLEGVNGISIFKYNSRGNGY